ncbi:hypothetical protein [Nocardia wallacei]|uniref:hypothetical protein n=1 Tax=Nocardia wallacei TaxID=480035 RepID=UPI002454FE52|nr:hypothetical protein [Nocardia wallacei]
MAQIEGKVGGTRRADIRSLDVIAVPGGIGELLPAGGLARGSVVGCRGATGVLAGVLAAVTAADLWAAVVAGANQRIGLVAVTEMGGRLSKLALIDSTAGDPVEIASVLADGIPLVVLDARLAVAPARARTMTAKFRSQRGVLVITDRVRGIRPDVIIDAQPAWYTGITRGSGRLREFALAVEVSGRNLDRPRRGQLLLASDGHGGTTWTRNSAAGAAAARRWSRAG